MPISGRSISSGPSRSCSRGRVPEHEGDAGEEATREEVLALASGVATPLAAHEAAEDLVAVGAGPAHHAARAREDGVHLITTNRHRGVGDMVKRFAPVGSAIRRAAS